MDNLKSLKNILYGFVLFFCFINLINFTASIIDIPLKMLGAWGELAASITTLIIYITGIYYLFFKGRIFYRISWKQFLLIFLLPYIPVLIQLGLVWLGIPLNVNISFDPLVHVDYSNTDFAIRSLAQILSGLYWYLFLIVMSILSYRRYRKGIDSENSSEQKTGEVFLGFSLMVILSLIILFLNSLVHDLVLVINYPPFISVLLALFCVIGIVWYVMYLVSSRRINIWVLISSILLAVLMPIMQAMAVTLSQYYRSEMDWDTIGQYRIISSCLLWGLLDVLPIIAYIIYRRIKQQSGEINLGLLKKRTWLYLLLAFIVITPLGIARNYIFSKVHTVNNRIIDFKKYPEYLTKHLPLFYSSKYSRHSSSCDNTAEYLIKFEDRSLIEKILQDKEYIASYDTFDAEKNFYRIPQFIGYEESLETEFVLNDELGWKIYIFDASELVGEEEVISLNRESPKDWKNGYVIGAFVNEETLEIYYWGTKW